MKLARLVLPFLAAAALAACTADSPTAPAPEAAPLRDESEECAIKIPVQQSDGTIVWKCSPQMGSGG